MKCQEILFVCVLLFRKNSCKPPSLSDVTYLEFTDELSSHRIFLFDRYSLGCAFGPNQSICTFTEKPVHVTEDILKNYPNLKRLFFNFDKRSSPQIDENALDSSPLLTELSMRHINVKRNYLKKLEQLQILYLAESTFQDESLFENLHNLEQLWISSSRIATIRQKLFKNLSKLSALILSQNQIEFIESDAFDNLKNLIGVDLRRNKIFRVDGCFKNLPKLTYLSISENYVEHVPWDEFKTLPSLEYLDLSDNRIKSFEAKSVSTYGPNLRVLKIFGNLVSPEEMKVFANEMEKKLNRTVILYLTFD